MIVHLVFWCALALGSPSASGETPVPGEFASLGWAAPVVQAVHALPPAAGEPADAPPPLVVFDFDNTMILGDISYNAMLIQARAHSYGFDPARRSAAFDPPARRLFRRWKRRSPALEGAERAALQAAIDYEVVATYHRRRAEDRLSSLTYLAYLLEGLTVEQARDLGRRAFAQARQEPVCTLHLDRPDDGEPALEHEWGLRPRLAVRHLVSHLEGMGAEVWVVSASPEPLVEGAAEWFGIPPERVVGVRPVVDSQGRILPRVEPPITWRQGKVEAIEKYIGRRPHLAFGDAWTDFEMLTWARTGVLIRRGKEDLEQALREAGAVLQDPFPGEPSIASTCPP